MQAEVGGPGSKNILMCREWPWASKNNWVPPILKNFKYNSDLEKTRSCRKLYWDLYSCFSILNWPETPPSHSVTKKYQDSGCGCKKKCLLMITQVLAFIPGHSFYKIKTRCFLNHPKISALNRITYWAQEPILAGAWHKWTGPMLELCIFEMSHGTC